MYILNEAPACASMRLQIVLNELTGASLGAGTRRWPWPQTQTPGRRESSRARVLGRDCR